VIITTVLLDGGGVIVDETEYEKVHAEIIAELLSKVVPGYNVEAYYKDVDDAVKSYCPSVYKYVLWKHSKNDLTAFNRMYTAYLEMWREQKPPLVLMDGIAEELEILNKDFDLVIAGQYGREILELLKSHSLLDLFKHHITQDDFSITKPDPRYYEQIIKTCGVKSEQCLMVGDRIDKDVIPARQLGMKTVMVRGGLHRNQYPRIPDEIPDAEINGVAGLAETVYKLSRLWI